MYNWENKIYSTIKKNIFQCFSSILKKLLICILFHPFAQLTTLRILPFLSSGIREGWGL